MKKWGGVAGLWWILVLGVIPSAQAAVHEVSIDMEELWQAVIQVAEKYGIDKRDDSKKDLETRWHVDHIQRDHSLLPFKKMSSMKLKETFLRRTKLKVHLEKSVINNVKITIRGRFQQKTLDANYTGWKRLKPDLMDYQVERDFFYDVLHYLEEKRLQKSPVGSPALSPSAVGPETTVKASSPSS
ncbi:MAG: hypothetical protein ACOY3K_02495 [Candidatus Omnitrophota bacterium]